MSFKKHLEKQQLSNGTIESYLRTSELFLEWFKSEGLKPEKAQYTDMLAYMQYASKKGDSKRYINVQLAVVRHYFNYLIKMGKVTDNIAANLYVQGVSRRLPHDLLDEETLYSIYENYPVKGMARRRNKVMLGVMIYQGVNTEEIGKLEVEHLQLKEGKIYIPGGRRSNSRLLPLAAHQVLELKEYIDQTRPLILAVTEKESDKLFVSTGQSIKIINTTTKLIQSVQQYLPQVKSTKQIRMSVITFWLQKFNLREVQYMAGHRYVSSTERYLLTSLDDLQKDLNEYHPL